MGVADSCEGQRNNSVSIYLVIVKYKKCVTLSLNGALCTIISAIPGEVGAIPGEVGAIPGHVTYHFCFYTCICLFNATLCPQDPGVQGQPYGARGAAEYS